MNSEQKRESTGSVGEVLKTMQLMQSGEESAKAYLFTLIVYTNESLRTESFRKIAALIAEQFPCRMIFIEENPGSDQPYLHLTSESKAEKQALHNSVTLKVAGNDLLRIPFVILPLLIPDLPVYLLWGQDPATENAILAELEKFASRVIFDSETSPNLQKFCQNMLDRTLSGPPEVIDMNWSRILGWREVLAQTYDNPEGFEQLARASTIKITYNYLSDAVCTHPETQAIYLRAWLASRLDWKPKDSLRNDPLQTIRYTGLEGEHEIGLACSRDSRFDSEEIIEIEVKGQNDYVCHFKRIDRNRVEVHAYNQYQCELPFTLLMPTLDSGRNIMQEIFYQKAGLHYIRLLKFIASMPT